jgi:hypothetical protein
MESVVRADYDADKFQVAYYRGQSDSPAILNLEMTFKETEHAPGAARKAAIGRLVDIAALPPTPERWEDVQALLRPVLRPVIADPRLSIVSRPLVGYLAEMLVVDTPSAMRYVGTGDVERWGVGVEVAFDAAHRNMARTVTDSLDAARRRAGTPRPARMADNGDSYVTSLPLIEGWLAALGRIAGARPLAFPTSNNTLLVAYETDDADDPDGVTIPLRAAEREWREATRPVSPAPLTVDDEGNVVLYTVPAEHPEYAAVKHATIVLAMSAYGSQTEYLRSVAGPDDPFPAALKGFRSPDGTEVTGATWTDGIESLLPAADLVLFPKEGEDMLMIPWSVVGEEVALTPAEGYYPARYRVGSWPAQDVLERMAKRGVEMRA